MLSSTVVNNFIFQYLQIQVITRCTSTAYSTLAGLMNMTNLLLFLFLFFLSLITATVPSSTFRRGGLATYKAVVLVILPCPLVHLARFTLILSQHGLQYHALLWLEFCWTSVLSAVVLIVLFAPSVSCLHHVHSYLSSPTLGTGFPGLTK